MALSSSLKLVLSQPQLPANKTITVKQACLAPAPPQVSSKTIQQLPQLACPSRREAILCLTTSLVANALFATEPAEAQAAGLEITKTITEKLQELLGLLKLKTEHRPIDEVKKLPKNENDQAVNMLEMLKEKAGISKPNSDSGSNGVEVQKQTATQSNSPMDVVEKLKEMAGGSKLKTDLVSSSGEMKLPVEQK